MNLYLSDKLKEMRSKKNISQEKLAQYLNVSFQAVSKWENDQCCPDIEQLPALAELFGVSIDALLGRPDQSCAAVPGLPWEDDETVRIVVMQGHGLLAHYPPAEKITFEFVGEAVDVKCALSLSCGDVAGDVKAEGSVSCGDVSGDVQAEGTVNCGAVGGDVEAEGSVNCGDVAGSVDAGGSVTCEDVTGDVEAEGSVTCGDVGGDVDAGSTVSYKAE